MKNLRKFFIASIILIVIGTIGLIAEGIVLNFTYYPGSIANNPSYLYGPSGMMGMMRGFNFGIQNK
ncbi:MAG: hypothetical protein FJW56_06460, partial [Actinobacteria bacterium]|nr:hypothetical protein [Actinomycetota bacterium]